MQKVNSLGLYCRYDEKKYYRNYFLAYRNACMVPILLTVSILKTGLTQKQIEILSPILLFLLVVVPIFFIATAMTLGRVRDGICQKGKKDIFFGCSPFCVNFRCFCLYFWYEAFFFNHYRFVSSYDHSCRYYQILEN